MKFLDEALRINGAVKLTPGEHPYSREDVADLAEICPKLPRSEALGRENRLTVGRIVADPVDVVREELGQDRVLVADPDLAQPILQIAANDDVLLYWGDVLGIQPTSLLRAQTNFMSEQGEVGFHSDHESNPDYRASVILSLSSDYAGGDFLVKMAPDDLRSYRLEAGDVLVVKPDVLHAVSRVESGTRMSLVLFLS